ncbi:Bromodomain-containing protein, partial [Blyttiomyces helicus]
FLEPVDLQYVPDYMSVIKQPMDFGTMGIKVKRREYPTTDAFKADFELVIKNAMTYNAPGSVYYRSAEKI